MAPLKIAYARCSTDDQDLTAQRDTLTAFGVDPERIYVDHGLTGTNRARPVLREAMADCRAGDTLVAAKLDRLARSLPDARDIVAELTARQVKVSIGGSVHDPTDPVGRLLFNVLAWSPSSLARSRTREGMKVAKAKGRLRGKQRKLSPSRKPTSSVSTTPAGTPAANSKSCSALPVRRSTGRSNATGHARPAQCRYRAAGHPHLVPPHQPRIPPTDDRWIPFRCSSRAGSGRPPKTTVPATSEDHPSAPPSADDRKTVLGQLLSEVVTIRALEFGPVQRGDEFTVGQQPIQPLGGATILEILIEPDWQSLDLSLSRGLYGCP